MPKEFHREGYGSDNEYKEKRKKTRGEGKKKKIGRAPRKIVGIPNPDKKRHESYKKGQNLARFPKPFKLVLSGPPSSGKSLMALHVLFAHCEKKPKFDEVHIIHGCKSSHTKEWDRIEPTSMRQEIPSYEEFDPKLNTLLIYDDTDYTNLNRDELMRLSEMVRFGSSHCNISCIFLTQVFFRIPKVIKDCANVFIVYKPTDLDELATLGRRVGLKKDRIKKIFKEHLPNWRDNLTINLIPSAPHKYVKNVFEPLDLDSDDDSD